MDIEVLMNKYQQATNKVEDVAKSDLSNMLENVKKKHPRLEITDIESKDGNIYIVLENGVSARFSSPNDFPIWVIPEGKTSRPKSWHRQRYMLEDGLLCWDPNEK